MKKTLKIQKHTAKYRPAGTPKFKSRYYFRIVARNGEIVAQSEGYNTARARNKTAKLLAESKIEIEVEPEE